MGQILHGSVLFHRAGTTVSIGTASTMPSAFSLKNLLVKAQHHFPHWMTRLQRDASLMQQYYPCKAKPSSSQTHASCGRPKAAPGAYPQARRVPRYSGPRFGKRIRSHRLNSRARPQPILENLIVARSGTQVHVLPGHDTTRKNREHLVFPITNDLWHQIGNSRQGLPPQNRERHSPVFD